MEGAGPLQENMARDDQIQDSSPLRVLKPQAWSSKTLNQATVGGSQSLPNSPRFGSDKNSDISLVESRHQWIHKELLRDTKANDRRGLTSSASFSPRSHVLVDQRHQWIETEILSKHSAFQRVDAHRLSLGATIAVDSVLEEAESLSMSRDRYLSNTGSTNSTADPQQTPARSFSPIIFLGDVESPHHIDCREERPFFMDTDDRTAVVALDSAATMTDIEEDDESVEAATEQNTSVLVAIAHEETVEILMENKSREYTDAVEVSMKGDSFMEEPSQKPWSNREDGTALSRQVLVEKAAASEKLSELVAGIWKHETITVVSSEVPINEMTDIDIIERIWAHDKSPALEDSIDIRTLQTIDSTASNVSDVDVIPDKNAVEVLPLEYENPKDDQYVDALAEKKPSILSANDISFVKSFQRSLLVSTVDPTSILQDFRGQDSSSFESGELIPDSKLRVHLETPEEKVPPTQIESNKNSPDMSYPEPIDSMKQSPVGNEVIEKNSACICTESLVSDQNDLAQDDPTYSATESSVKASKVSAANTSADNAATIGVSSESVNSASIEHAEGKARSIESLETCSLDFLHTRKGTAFVDHAKRSAQRFHKAREQLMEDRRVRQAVSRESSSSFRDNERSAHREHAARSAQLFQNAREELLDDTMVGELLKKVSVRERMSDEHAVCVEDPTESSDNLSTKNATQAFGEIVRVPTVDDDLNGKKDISKQVTVSTPCVASCVVM